MQKKVAAIVLAAGQSTRMGSSNKLLAEINGELMIAKVLNAIAASEADEVIVVLGHEADQVSQKLIALRHPKLTWLVNDNYRAGIATSLTCGIAALANDITGALICLSDMPYITTADYNQIIQAYRKASTPCICIPFVQQQRGNPLLWDQFFFPEIKQLQGDTGAKQLLKKYRQYWLEVPFTSNNVLLDIDCPEALLSALKLTE